MAALQQLQRKKGEGTGQFTLFRKARLLISHAKQWLPFLQAGTPASHKSLAGSYISTKKELPRVCFQNRAGGEQPGGAAYCWWGTTLCVRQALLRLNSQFSKNIFLHGTVLLKNNEVSWFLAPTKFHSKQVRKLPPTGIRTHLLSTALARTSQIWGSHEFWIRAGDQKPSFWGEAALLRQPAPPVYRCQHIHASLLLISADVLNAVLTLKPQGQS